MNSDQLHYFDHSEDSFSAPMSLNLNQYPQKPSSESSSRPDTMYTAPSSFTQLAGIAEEPREEVASVHSFDLPDPDSWEVNSIQSFEGNDDDSISSLIAHDDIDDLCTTGINSQFAGVTLDDLNQKNAYPDDLVKSFSKPGSGWNNDAVEPVPSAEVTSAYFPDESEPVSLPLTLEEVEPLDVDLLDTKKKSTSDQLKDLERDADLFFGERKNVDRVDQDCNNGLRNPKHLLVERLRLTDFTLSEHKEWETDEIDFGNLGSDIPRPLSVASAPIRGFSPGIGIPSNSYHRTSSDYGGYGSRNLSGNSAADRFGSSSDYGGHGSRNLSGNSAADRFGSSSNYSHGDDAYSSYSHHSGNGNHYGGSAYGGASATSGRKARRRSLVETASATSSAHEYTSVTTDPTNINSFHSFNHYSFQNDFDGEEDVYYNTVNHSDQIPEVHSSNTVLQQSLMTDNFSHKKISSASSCYSSSSGHIPERPSLESSRVKSDSNLLGKKRGKRGREMEFSSPIPVSESVVKESDKTVATAFSFAVLSEVKSCSYGPSDLTGKRKGLPHGFKGLACRYCNGKTKLVSTII